MVSLSHVAAVPFLTGQEIPATVSYSICRQIFCQFNYKQYMTGCWKNLAEVMLFPMVKCQLGSSWVAFGCYFDLADELTSGSLSTLTQVGHTLRKSTVMHQDLLTWIINPSRSPMEFWVLVWEVAPNQLSCSSTIFRVFKFKFRFETHLNVSGALES